MTCGKVATGVVRERKSKMEKRVEHLINVINSRVKASPPHLLIFKANLCRNGSVFSDCIRTKIFSCDLAFAILGAIFISL